MLCLCSPAGRVNPRYVSTSPMSSPRMTAATPVNGAPPPVDDVGRYLRHRVADTDRHTNNLGHDTLMVYHYEGGESEPGTVSEVRMSHATCDGSSGFVPSSRLLPFALIS